MAVDLTSAFSVGGALSENVYDLALDGAGNTCVVGGFSGTLDFDPGPGVYELTGGGTFAAKYDPNGSLLWAQRVGASNSSFNFGPEIAAGTDGSVYVVGTFENTGTFGSTTLTSAGDDDAYVVKLDDSGNIAWANRFGGPNADWGNDVAVDGNGNVYVMAETRDAGTNTPDSFIAKMDVAGNVLWSMEVGASSSPGTPLKGKPGQPASPTGWTRGFKLTVDSAGDVYATGRTNGTVDFDAGAGTTKLSGTGYVMKVSTGGNLVWARTFEGGYVNATDIAVDDGGNVYTTGLYNYSVDFDPGIARSQKFILSTSGNYAAYVSALDSSGNFLWAKSAGGNTARVEAMALDGSGGIYLAGGFSGTADFDPGPGTFNLTSAGDADAFIWKLDTSGNFVWAGQMGGAGADRAHGIGVDAIGNMFVAGSFTGTADFDPGAGTYNLTSAGGNDIFVAKFVQPVALAAAESQASSLSLTTSSSRRLSSNAKDSALAEDFGNKGSAGWRHTLDDALLVALASI